MKFAQYTESKPQASKQIREIKTRLKKTVVEDEDENEYEYDFMQHSSSYSSSSSFSSSLSNAQWLRPLSRCPVCQLNRNIYFSDFNGPNWPTGST